MLPGHDASGVQLDGPAEHLLGAGQAVSVLEFAAAFQPDLLGGVTLLRANGRQRGIVETDDGYRIDARDVALTAVPYYAWDNREPGEMRVWIREGS